MSRENPDPHDLTIVRQSRPDPKPSDPQNPRPTRPPTPRKSEKCWRPLYLLICTLHTTILKTRPPTPIYFLIKSITYLIATAIPPVATAISSVATATYPLFILFILFFRPPPPFHVEHPPLSDSKPPCLAPHAYFLTLALLYNNDLHSAPSVLTTCEVTHARCENRAYKGTLCSL